MAPRQQVDDREVYRLKRAGLSPIDIGKELRVSRATVYRALQRLGEVRDYVWHDFPWTIDKKHALALPLKYMRSLDSAAQTGGGDMEYLHAAFGWANDLIDRKRDVDYRPDYEGTELDPSGGFFETPEPPGGGFIRKLRDAALQGPK
jgi:hypothetical protein